MRNDQYQSARPAGGGIKKLKVTNEVFNSKVSASNKEGSTEETEFKGSSYLLKSMLNIMLNPISYKDRNGRYLGINERFSRQVFGLPEEEIVGYTLLEVCNKFVERFPERSMINGVLSKKFVKNGPEMIRNS